MTRISKCITDSDADINLSSRVLPCLTSSSTSYYSHVMLRCLYRHLLIRTRVVDPLQPLHETAPNFFFSLVFWGELSGDWMKARLCERIAAVAPDLQRGSARVQNDSRGKLIRIGNKWDYLSLMTDSCTTKGLGGVDMRFSGSAPG